MLEFPLTAIPSLDDQNKIEKSKAFLLHLETEVLAELPNIVVPEGVVVAPIPLTAPDTFDVEVIPRGIVQTYIVLGTTPINLSFGNSGVGGITSVNELSGGNITIVSGSKSLTPKSIYYVWWSAQETDTHYVKLTRLYHTT